MAEGMTHVDQQVVDNGHWAASDRLAAGDHHPARDLGKRSTCKNPHWQAGEIARAVEADILPRLLFARPEGHDRVAVHSAPDTARIARFVQILLTHGDQAGASRFVEALRAGGSSVEDVCLQLLQPAARHLGALWDADVCSFVDVTLALGTLQRLLRDLSPAFQKQARRLDAGRQALLVPLPGDHHTFGLSMVGEFLRRSAWSVCTVPFDCRDDLGRVTRDTWCTVVGFSLGSENRLDELAAAIEAVRRHSCNRSIGVLVGGPVFAERPDYVARVGADAMGLDARQAVFQAECFAV